MARKLWMHQELALKRYADREFFGLLFPAGTGKTAAAARIAEAKGRPVLVIAPNALCEQWRSELTNRDGDTRITERDWEVVVCTSKSRGTKAFRRALDSLLESEL